MSTKSYSVHQSANRTLSIVDIQRNATVHRVSITGDLTNGPIVMGDRCTFITKHNSNQTGYVMKLPSGAIVDRFVVR